ncbi:14-3-3-like protein d isoform x1 [Anaeramoeba ignava]|uniref:14-3-3-like protein d isoform x1 n=1 Tax=Anaeramoeba ignava TaxID=1746090 RepID=A0A9Q0LH68_ANAIG|nr:14-3-3-like protein d isoform x1 [Anaeramoeba ignava]|eukprot:Anaeramoba_ignava/c20065_g3_i1.p1 GENE.c20065_g3_i1~~c20065_g3_i1.p1  ORF type:complete len:262 (-),score=86.88 c20065_g3_i1:142-927(-)
MDQKERDFLVFVAKMCEQARRYEEMRDAMKSIIQVTGELTTEERNLLSVAYKNLITPKRYSIRVFTSFEERETENGNQTIAERIREKRLNSEKELKDICFEIISFIDEKLIPSATNDEGLVFYYKMKGDYCRYLAEFLKSDEKSKSIENSGESYKKGVEIGKNLSSTNPIRLGLSLNYSVFLYEILANHQEAFQFAKQAFDEARPHIDSLSDKSYNDTILVMQLLRDNLNSWAKDFEAQGDEDEDDDDDDTEELDEPNQKK